MTSLRSRRIASRTARGRCGRERGSLGPTTSPAASASRASSSGSTVLILASAFAAAAAEFGIAALGDPARAQHQRLDLGAREHQRRQQEARLEHITEPRFAVDFRAAPAQRVDVAVERTQADAELFRQPRARHRSAMATQNVEEFQNAIGARHVRVTLASEHLRPPVAGRCKIALTVGSSANPPVRVKICG